MSDEQWQAMLDVHLTAPFRVIRAAPHYLRETAKREKEDAAGAVLFVASPPGDYVSGRVLEVTGGL